MDHAATGEVAQRSHRALESLHSLTYFAPETEERLTACGLRPGRMCYFAGRAAPMGAVGAGTVTATFFNFNPALVARHIPRAWTLASPADIVPARFEAADRALRRLLGDDVVASPDVAEAAALARTATEGCTVEGRPLYAGPAELPWPTQPHLVLWHAITLLREFRGDGHIAALVGGGLSGLAALITHTAAGSGFVVAAAKATRGWSDEEWSEGAEALVAAGIIEVDANGTPKLTEQGKVLRGRVEDETNQSATAPWRLLGADKAARLQEIGRTLGRRAVEAGAFPAGVFTDPGRRPRSGSATA
jgi:hypothetical protein